MLTGALAPTSGTAKILGKDLHSQLSAVRDDLGICLQHDCLFPDMTVREHIQFFSRLKGLYQQMSYREAEDHVDQIIKDVALYEKRNSFSKNLSGGMKRKLSVAIAFCGGSKVVLLDEPTSGMDPFSRRFTWNVIRQYRQNRCILLTTHFMDEADVLGDRIAIMSEGQLRCIGSPLFLKKHYGVGYQLTIEKEHDFVGKASQEELKQLNSELIDIVQGNVKNAALLNNVGSELSFQLPVGEAASFSSMFQGLDQKVEKGMISSYGVGITTLEEVVRMAKVYWAGSSIPDWSKISHFLSFGHSLLLCHSSFWSLVATRWPSPRRTWNQHEREIMVCFWAKETNQRKRVLDRA
jgi:ABC-type multidrug transport system ATPase subunit